MTHKNKLTFRLFVFDRHTYKPARHSGHATISKFSARASPNKKMEPSDQKWNISNSQRSSREQDFCEVSPKCSTRTNGWLETNYDNAPDPRNFRPVKSVWSPSQSFPSLVKLPEFLQLADTRILVFIVTMKELTQRWHGSLTPLSEYFGALFV